MTDRDTPPSLRHALQQAQQQGLGRLDAQMLLLMALDRDTNGRAWLMAHDDEIMAPEAVHRWTKLMHRRLAGEPLAYIAGSKAFFGLQLQLDDRVLVPRPDTETLVIWSLEVLDTLPAGARFLDLGTGSGAIALAIKSQRPGVEVGATDASSGALEVARGNARRLNLSIEFQQGLWLQAVSGQRFDVIASNPPYIAEGDPHLADLKHEPISALTAGPDGLEDIRILVDTAPGALRPGGWLLLEHGHDQGKAVRELLRSRGFRQVMSRTDLAGIDRCSGGQWPSL